MITSLTLFALLSIPTIWELWMERKGEAPEHKKISASVRAMLMNLAAGIATGIVHPRIYPWVTSVHLWPLTVTYLKCLALSFAIFFLVFDYAINLILGRKPWFSYLGNSPIDRIMGKVNWKVRMEVRVVVFITAIIWFYS